MDIGLSKAGTATVDEASKVLVPELDAMLSSLATKLAGELSTVLAGLKGRVITFEFKITL